MGQLTGDRNMYQRQLNPHELCLKSHAGSEVPGIGRGWRGVNDSATKKT